MKKRTIICGIVFTMIISSMSIAYAAAGDEKGAAVEKKFSTTQELVSLSLDQAIDYALEHSKDIEIQDIELQKAEISYEENKRAIRKLEKEADNRGVIVPFMLTDDNDVNRFLLKNGAIMRSVELTYQMANWNKEMTENRIIYSVEKAYFDLLHTENALSIAQESLNLAKQIYDHGKLKYDLGNISQQHLLELELGLSQAQSTYDACKLNYDMQMMSFKDTLGIPFNKIVDLTDSIEYKEHEEIDLDSSIDKALKSNAGIKIAEENYEISKLIFDAIGIKYPDITYRYKSEEVKVVNAAKNLENAKKGVEMGVRAAYLNLLTAQKQINTYEKAVEQAQKALDIVKTSFELGMATTSEINQANIALMNAKNSLSQQIHAYNMALLDYEYSIGIGMGI